MSHKDKIILGLDPGTLIMGFGVIEIVGGKVSMLDFGDIYLKDIKEPYARLAYIIDKTRSLISEFSPDECAIEAPFYGKNVQSMLKLGRAQGVAIATAYGSGLPVTEYSPKEIKQSITGRGNANKEQVWRMIQRIMDIDIEPKNYDGTDALSVALCHHYRTEKGLDLKGKNKKGWEAFISENPERVKKN